MRGQVLSFDAGLLRVQRRFSGGGRYDTLDCHKRAGDHGLIEVPEHGWVLRRVYLRRDNTLIGELYNIQTPVEFERGIVRYLDLEVDVARWADGRVQVVDQADLERAVASGSIAPELAEVALEIASRVADLLRVGGDWWSAAYRAPAT
jgi:Ribonuclease G/E